MATTNHGQVTKKIKRFLFFSESCTTLLVLHARQIRAHVPYEMCAQAMGAAGTGSKQAIQQSSLRQENNVYRMSKNGIFEHVYH